MFCYQLQYLSYLINAFVKERLIKRLCSVLCMLMGLGPDIGIGEGLFCLST